MPAGKRSKLHPRAEEQKKLSQQVQLHPTSFLFASPNEPSKREKLSAKRPWKDFASHHMQHEVNGLVCVEGVEASGGAKQRVMMLGREQSGLIVDPKALVNVSTEMLASAGRSGSCGSIHLYALGQARVHRRIFCCSWEAVGRAVTDFQPFLPSLASGRQAGLCHCLAGGPQASLRAVIYSVFTVKTCPCTQNGPFSVLIEHGRCGTHRLPCSVRTPNGTSAWIPYPKGTFHLSHMSALGSQHCKGRS